MIKHVTLKRGSVWEFRGGTLKRVEISAVLSRNL